MSISSVPRYSAKVRLSLMIADQRLSVGKVGPDSLFLREPRDIPAGTQATIIVSVDGEETHYPALLHDGASAESPRVAYS